MASEPKKEQALPVNFGKRLAHTDKVVRDRSFKTLKKWLTQHPELDRLEYMKLWKGLYFCMWMADKRPVQQELAVNIALLANDVPAEKQSMWFDTFWETMQTSWEKLDVHRVNKYLLFTRIVFAEAFKILRLAGWPPERLKATGETFTRALPGATAKATQSIPSLGFLLQFIRVFWAELLPQVDLQPTPEPSALMYLLEPFCTLAETSPVRNLVARIHEHVLRQAPARLHKLLAERLLAGAPSAELKTNREALYETAEYLEGELRRAASAAAKAKLGGMSPLSLPQAAVPAEEAVKKSKTRRGKRRRKQKRPAGEADDDEAAEDCQDEAESDAVEGGPSPLILPEAALPIKGGLKKKRRTLNGKEDGHARKKRKKKQGGT